MSRSENTNKGNSRKVNSTNRIPVGGKRDVLTVHGKDPDFHHVIVTDRDGQVDTYLRGGYEVVQDADASFGSRRVDQTKSGDSVASVSVGTGDTGFLMRIKMEWHLEDQAAAQKEITDMENARFEELNSGKDGTYGEVKLNK